MHPAERRIPFLDGLRALAVLLVVNHHASAAVAERFGESLWTRFPLTVNGWMGVDLFYVLSGFFIGGQLWRELQRTGTISLKWFMVRRNLRIWPLYFFTFAVVFALAPHAAAAKGYGWSDLLFLTNYTNHGIVMGGWSLSTEEQFYLLTPVLLLLAGRRSGRWYRGALLGIWAAEIAVRVAEYVHFAGYWRVKDAAAFGHLYYPLHTHSDGLLAGLLVSNLLAGQPAPRPRRAALVPVLGLVALGVGWRLQSETLDFAGLAVFFGALVWWGVQTGSRLFSGRLAYWLSRLSFGMYLNHPYLIGPALAMLAPLLRGRLAPLGAAVLFLVLATVSALLSVLTFCLVEHPFLVLRTAMLRRKEAVPLVAH